ncbi:hypothetical protein P691DRAFT_791106 [Macrolepiota fuliginosa MF-IS2]|uniref:Uncharacterized protein n=1 Tax=Macrolepiota fuliginosa MF-IS2 TaxID=1400762 RepID=A0A9P6C2D6_9AGAR|nr:hypothetical protein P691DRAFT_791106 [Macrolepiota fuliginosa MF-IS2]
MAHKPQMKTAASDPKLSDTTVAFLNAQNQDLHTKSIMQMSLLITLPELVQVQVRHELDAIGFTYEAPTLPLPPPVIPKEEEDSNNNKMDIHLFNDTLHSLIIWTANEGFNNKANFEARHTMVKHIHVLACEFNVAKVITLPTPPPPPPCTQPHSNEEDIHMEPPAPTHVFSEAATQTPAPLPVPATPTPPLLECSWQSQRCRLSLWTLWELLASYKCLQISLLMTLPELMQIQVCCKLNAIGFTYEAPALPLPPTESHDKEEELIMEDEANINLFNDTLTALYKCVGNEGFTKETNFDAQDTLIKHIFKLAKAFNMVKILAQPTPSPPPPCTQPHSNKEDIHMEPPAPTHVFSEAATQTPAPLPMPATPTPPPLPMMSAPAASTSPKPGPPSRPSFPEAVAKALCPNAPPLCKAQHEPHSPPLRPPKVPS